MSGTAIPTIASENVILRPLRAGDLDAFAAMQANPDVMRYLGTGAARTRDETWDAMARMLGHWDLRGYGVFAIEHAASGRFVGRAGILHPLSWPEPELAYAIDAPFWRQGLATQACRAILGWVRHTLDLPRLPSFILAENAASIAVVRRLGAVRTGDVTILGLTAQRWQHSPDGAGKG